MKDLLLILLCMLAAAGMLQAQDVACLVAGQPQHQYPLPGRPDAVATDDLDGRLRVEIRDGHALVRMTLAPGEVVWGAGQRMDAYNLRGTQFDVWAEDSWNRWDSSYFATPWFISSEGHAIFINCTGRLRVEINEELRVWVPDPGAEVWVFRGSPRELVSAYTALVGRPHDVPDWVFEPWLSRNSYLGSYEINRTLAKGEQLGFRFGAVVLEAWAEQLHNFRFERRRYPDTADWIASLRKRGVHVVCWITPSVWTTSTAYATANTNGWLVRNADGSEHVTRWLEQGRKIDFRHEAARAWWRDQQRPLIDLGVAGFKTDGGEHMPDPWFHNEHPYHYQRATLDAFRAERRKGISFARSGNPITAGNSTFWGGDQHAEWSNLAAVVRGGLSAAWSGHFFWAHDVGGYTGTPSPELYVRWLQFGVFSPLFQLHGIEPREPWRFGGAATAIARGYFKARERLKPYLVSLAADAREEGWPVMRPMAWAFPEDRATYTIGDQFMLGEDLLVAPILDASNTREIYWPSGEWLDLWSGEMIVGPARKQVTADLAHCPVYARAEAAHRWQHLLRDVPRGALKPDDPPPAPLFDAVSWRVLGWLPGGVASRQPLDGAKPNLNQTAAGLDDSARRWMDVPVSAHLPDGAIDLGRALGPAVFATAYLQTTIESRVRQRVRLLAGCGDAMTVWINERKILDRPVHRNPDRDEDAVDVTLAPGENRILLRISRDIAEPRVYFRFVAM